jgi:DNA sulfur modification protein DndD
LRIDTEFSAEFSSDNHIQDPEECEEFLARRLPKNIAPFFFYDGEKVQEIAEANREGLMHQIELLLGLAAVDTLDEYLGTVVTEWRRQGLAPNVSAELDQQRAKILHEEAECHKLEAQISELTIDIDNLERLIARNQRYREQTLSQQLDVPRLEKEKDEAKQRLEEICQKIAESLPPAAPLWASPDLVAKLAIRLAEVTTNGNVMIAEEIRGILEHLPDRLLDEAPHPTPKLHDAQKEHLRKKLARICSQYTELPPEGFFNLSATECGPLKTRIDYFQQASNERQRLVEDLRLASDLRHKLEEAEEKFDKMDNLRPEEKEKFRVHQAKTKEAQEKRDRLLDMRGQFKIRLDRQVGDLERLRKEINVRETELVKANINSRRIDRVRQAQGLFEVYKQKLKELRRKEIEEAINRCFKALMTSNRLIDRIEIDERFAMTYRDREGNAVGMANISAGMKQIAAQALLWALSEVSGKTVPIVVDTPLARIDRQHQENLLQNYYPKAGRQVIVLPTDSELDREKYFLLRPHIGSEFHLSNPEGNHTDYHQGDMYPMDLN